MAVTIHCNGTSNSLVHKGNGGFTKCTLPDVCKTPSPGGPVPVPYPVIVSVSSDLAKGSTTVKIDGGNMVAVKGSEFSRCTGDEPGTAGGVKSSTNMKEATWILYSFDVKIEGKNACRLSDKMLMNHGNTACLGGHITKPVGLSPADDQLADDCMKLHDEYDVTKKDLAESKDQTYKDLKQKLDNNSATRAERHAFCDLVIARYELTEKLIRQRQQYVDMGCDKIDWVVDGQPNTKTAQERKESHVEAIDQAKNQLRNAERLINRILG
jgi:uncharacterized Zn-binding protein involved in type VI secretion